MKQLPFINVCNKKLMKKKAMNLKDIKKEVYGKGWREERKRGNEVIIL